MAAWGAKLVAWFVPLFLDWLAARGEKAIRKYLGKVEKDETRGKVNEKNLAKLEKCKDVHSCIIAARDAFNGTDAGVVPEGRPEVSDGN